MNRLDSIWFVDPLRGCVLLTLIVAAPLGLRAQWLANVKAESPD